METRLRTVFLFSVFLFNAGLGLAASNPVGILGRSRNAKLSGEPAQANQTVFDGDELSVAHGAANVVLVGGSRVEAGSGTVMSFHRRSQGVEADVKMGQTDFYSPAHSVVPQRLNAGGLSILGKAGSESLGRVIVAEHVMIVSALRGPLRLERGGRAFDVAPGKEVLLARESASPLPGMASPFSVPAGTGGLPASPLNAGSAVSHLCKIEEQYQHIPLPFNLLLDDICDKHENKLRQLCVAEAEDDQRPSPSLPEKRPLDDAIDAVCGDNQ